MTRKFFWVIAAAVLAMVCFDKTRSILERRRRADDKEELVRWWPPAGFGARLQWAGFGPGPQAPAATSGPV